MIWLYLILAPLLIMIAASRMNGARKLLITSILFVGGYFYIMFREATKHTGERARKRQFLERVAPRGQGGSGYNGNTGGNPAKSASYTPSPSPMSRQNSQYSGTQSPGPRGAPPMVRAPSAPLEFNKPPNKKTVKMSRGYSAQQPNSY